MYNSRGCTYFCNVLDVLIKYRYWILFGGFALWMLFFDSNNVFYRVSIANDVSELEETKDAYTKRIEELRRQRTELFGNQGNLEKFAREKYMMKKDNEDLFVVVYDSSALKK